MDEMTLTLNSPITEEQWDVITDVDFEYTNEVIFHTKHGKTIKFVKASAQPEIIRCGECKYYTSLLGKCEVGGKGRFFIRGLNDFCSRAERRDE